MEVESASIEWLDAPVGVLRVHPENGAYGDPYDWHCTIQKSGDTAILHGTLTAPSTSQFRAIRQILRDSGFKHARWIRIDGDERAWNLFKKAHGDGV